MKISSNSSSSCIHNFLGFSIKNLLHFLIKNLLHFLSKIFFKFHYTFNKIFFKISLSFSLPKTSCLFSSKKTSWCWELKQSWDLLDYFSVCLIDGNAETANEKLMVYLSLSLAFIPKHQKCSWFRFLCSFFFRVVQFCIKESFPPKIHTQITTRMRCMQCVDFLYYANISRWSLLYYIRCISNRLRS